MRARKEGKRGEGCDVLFFLEDAGAANFILDVPAALESRGIRCAVAAQGPARVFLAERGMAFVSLEGQSSSREALARCGPRLVALGTADLPDALNFYMADFCRAQAVPTVGFVDGYGNLERRFGTVDAPLTHAPDWILVPDARCGSAYAGFGLPAERVVACGHPAMDRAARERESLQSADRQALRAALFPKARADDRVVVFAAEAFRMPDASQYQRTPDYTLIGSGIFPGRTEIVLEEVLDAFDKIRATRGRGTGIHFVLRLHAKNTLEEFAPFLHRIDQLSQGGLVHELIFAADAVIGMTTILLAEAAFLGVPTLAVIPRRVEKDWLWTVGAGLTACAQTRAEVETEVGLLLAGDRPGDATGAGPQGDAVQRIVAFFEARLGSPVRG